MKNDMTDTDPTGVGTSVGGVERAGALARRRGFLAGVGIAGAAGAAAVAMKSGGPTPAATVATEAGEAAGAAPAGRGYRLSVHVRKYYDTTKV